MRWLTNTHDPKDPLASMYASIYCLPNQTSEQAWAQHLEYLRDKIIGRPHATEKYTVEELEHMGMVGVYVEDEEITQ